MWKGKGIKQLEYMQLHVCTLFNFVNLTIWHNRGSQSQIIFLSVITMGTTMLSCFLGCGSLKANT